MRDLLDQGVSFPAGVSPHSYAEALLAFLEATGEPLFPAPLCRQYNEAVPLTDFCRAAAALLPPAHYNSFILVVALLRETLSRKAVNGSNVTHLVSAFVNALTHADRYPPPPRLAPPPPSSSSSAAAGAAGAAGAGGRVGADGVQHSGSLDGTAMVANPLQAMPADYLPQLVVRHFLTCNDFTEGRF